MSLRPRRRAGPDSGLKLTFRPIDLDAEASVCVTYMRDLLKLNFGSDETFIRDYGEDGGGYIQWLRPRLVADPRAAVFACADSQPLGMVVTGRWRGDPSIGYVNQYYLMPAWRGRGLGRQLDDYAMSVLWTQGCRQARLTAASTNTAAVSFYIKLGWRNAGPRADVPGATYFTRQIPAPTLLPVD
jgi:ribosomal protein S18 acetylase RimI-like enzyme